MVYNARLTFWFFGSLTFDKSLRYTDNVKETKVWQHRFVSRYQSLQITAMKLYIMYKTFCFQVLRKLQDNPNLSRESLIRQSVGSYIETGDISRTLNEALKYTDTTTYINNTKR